MDNDQKELDLTVRLQKKLQNITKARTSIPREWHYHVSMGASIIHLILGARNWQYWTKLEMHSPPTWTTWNLHLRVCVLGQKFSSLHTHIVQPTVLCTIPHLSDARVSLEEGLVSQSQGPVRISQRVHYKEKCLLLAAQIWLSWSGRGLMRSQGCSEALLWKRLKILTPELGFSIPGLQPQVMCKQITALNVIAKYRTQLRRSLIEGVNMSYTYIF